MTSLAALAAVLALSAPRISAEPKYERDVAFLLDELEKQAAPLLQQKGVDWKAVRKEFEPLSRAVKDDVEHVRLCARLLARLKDGHAGFTKVDATMPDERTFGVGIALCEHAGKLYVKQASGAASASAIEAGFELVAVDGAKPKDWLAATIKKLTDVHGFSTAHAERYAAFHWGLAGPEGTTYELEFDRGKKGKKSVTLTCSKSAGDARYVGPIFPDKDWKPLGKRDAYTTLSSSFGYIYLGECAPDLPDELDTALAAIGDVPGMILDLRANNGGGTDHEAVFGRFLAPGAKWRQYSAAGTASFAGPLVVIVDEGTRSAGETVAGQFKEDGRAYMIGPGPTHGMSAQKAELRAPSGLFTARFATASNKQRFNGGKGIEGIGVAPHEVVDWDPKTLQRGVDPMIERAEALLKKGFPKGVVPYEPPKASRR